MASPDRRRWTDLSPFDRDARQIVDRSLADAGAKVPDWTPRAGNTEVVLLEGLALEGDEFGYALNRTTRTVGLDLAIRFGLELDLGAPPTATILVTAIDNAGHDLPAGTRFRLDLGGSYGPVLFATDAATVVAPGATTVVVAATGDRRTDQANGTAAASPLTLIDSLVWLDHAELATPVAAGANPETDDDLLDRLVARLDRLTDAFVLPRHFVDAALENPLVYRATALDRYNPSTNNEKQQVAITGAPTGGTFPLTFAGQVTAGIAYNATAAIVQAALEALSNIAPGDVAVTGGPLPATPVVVEFLGAYAGQNLAAMTTSSVGLTGGAGPAVAVTTPQNGGGFPPGTSNGHVTVAVCGVAGALLSTADKAALLATLQAGASGDLTIHVIDPTFSAVAVDYSVVKLAGWDAATVQANVAAALAAYLSADAWPWAGTVRRNELIALIDNVAGVDYVVGLTTPAADVVLVGVAPLATLGAVTPHVA